MQKDLIWIFLICQLIIQAAIYITMCRPLFKMTIKLTNLLLKECDIDLRWLNNIYSCLMMIFNIGISLLVLKFTNAGATAGITNMVASVILGIFMLLDVKLLTRRTKVC